MDREQKYIIDERGNFIIFSRLYTHADVARGRGSGALPIVGAGLCNFAIGHYKKGTEKELTHVNVHCYGESYSLGISSREIDEEIITNTLNGFND